VSLPEELVEPQALPVVVVMPLALVVLVLVWYHCEVPLSHS
jgi:hypothetical protein